MKLKAIDFFNVRATKHSRMSWLQNPGCQVTIALAVSIANISGALIDMVSQVLHPQTSRMSYNLLTEVD